MAHAVVTLREADLDEIGRPNESGQFPALNGLLLSIDEDLRELSDAITHHYFSHAQQRVS